MADHVSSNSHAIVETDDDGTHLTLVTDTGEVELVGEPHELEKLVVDADRQLNREAEPDG